MKLKQDSLSFILGSDIKKESTKRVSKTEPAWLQSVRRKMHAVLQTVRLKLQKLAGWPGTQLRRIPRMRRRRYGIALLLAAVLLLSACINPGVRTSWLLRQRAKAVEGERLAVLRLTEEEILSFQVYAQAYNERIAQLECPLSESAVDGEYEALLNPDDSGRMGCLTIGELRMPIYHGTDEMLAQSLGAVHVPGTSLPVDGESTHCVLTLTGDAADAANRLATGDTFTLTVLGEDAIYQVTDKTATDPSDTEALAICSGEEICTLIVCHGCGVRSQRLLIRAVRAVD